MVQKIFEELDEDYRGQMYLGQDVGIDGNTIVASGSDYRTRVYYKEGEAWEPSVVIVASGIYFHEFGDVVFDGFRWCACNRHAGFAFGWCAVGKCAFVS